MLFILDLGNENACQETGRVLNVVQCAFLVRPPPRGILHVVASTWCTLLALCFRSNQEAPVVSELVNTRSKRLDAYEAHLRSSLPTTPLGYKATYKRGLSEGMLQRGHTIEYRVGNTSRNATTDYRRSSSVFVLLILLLLNKAS